MKLRTRRGSIRFRLSQKEVQALAQRGVVEESVNIGGSGALVYTLVSSASHAAIAAHLDGGELTVRIPYASIQRWATSIDVGLESRQAVDGDESLLILIEKDFACLTPRAEDDADAFPHPGGTLGDCS